MTKEEILKVYDFIQESDPDKATRTMVETLEKMGEAYNELSDEEKDTFPENFVPDFNVLYNQTCLSMFINNDLIEQIKQYAEEELAPHYYRKLPPYYRAKCAMIYSMACITIVARTPEDNEEQRELWTFRGLKAIEVAVDIFGRCEDNDGLYNALSLKMDLLKNKSVKEAIESAQVAIRYFGSGEYMEEMCGKWRELNDLRFEYYFDNEDVRFIESLPLSDEKKNELMTELNTNCQQFCNIEPVYDRNTILIVDEISDITREDMQESVNEAHYIFEIDRIPKDVKFAGGDPVGRGLYVLEEDTLDTYKPADL